MIHPFLSTLIREQRIDDIHHAKQQGISFCACAVRINERVFDRGDVYTGAIRDNAHVLFTNICAPSYAHVPLANAHSNATDDAGPVFVCSSSCIFERVFLFAFGDVSDVLMGMGVGVLERGGGGSNNLLFR